MCGIFGYVANGQQEGGKNVVLQCLKGLKSLEYRGYDSAGLAGIRGKELLAYKQVGKVGNLQDYLIKSNVELDIAIAHTRWATHGGLTELNAHPHFDDKRALAIVHNGIIENFQELKKQLERHAIIFSSETDTEVIPQMLGYYYTQNDFIQAIVQANAQMEGSFAFACIHQDFPDTIYAAARECPLIVAQCEVTRDIFISSDANALSGRKMQILFLQDGEIAEVSPNSITIYNREGTVIEKLGQSLGITMQETSKNGYEHYMLKEIFEQPVALERAIAQHFDRDNTSIHFNECISFRHILKKIDHIRIIGCGTSYHAGLLLSSVFEELTKTETAADIASEFRYKNPILRKNTLVIALSQSGETADTLAALRLAKNKGALTLGFGNVAHSTLAREADMFVELQAGPEISVCSTKAFTSQIVLLLLFALFLKQKKHVLDTSHDVLFRMFIELPTLVTSVLHLDHAIKNCAERCAPFQNFFFLGRHLMYPTAMEAALKLKEISYRNASAYPAGELKHGPIALIDEQLPTIALLGNDITLAKMMNNLMEIKARNGPIIAFAPRHLHSLQTIASDIVWMPEHIPDFFSPILYAVATQLFAYYIAKLQGAEIDQPRNLAKSVTVE